MNKISFEERLAYFMLAFLMLLSISIQIWLWNCNHCEEPEVTEPEPTCEVTVEPTTEVQAKVIKVSENLEKMPKPDPKPIAPTEPEVDPEEKEMLAILIYQEAGGDACCDECRRRVADVALNRVNDPRFPNPLEEVLLQQGQYGRLHWTGIKWADRAKNECEQHAVERARRIAEEVLKGHHSDLYGKGYVWQAGFHQGADEIYHCGHYFGR